MKYIPILFIITICSELIFSQTSTEKKIKFAEDKITTFSDSQIFYTQKLEVLKLQWIRDEIKQYGLPKISGDGMLINHLAMSMFYDEKHGQSQWVVHIILPDIKNGVQTRTNDFRKDSMIISGTPGKEDYFNSGYDRGHLAASADFRWSKRALSESYYYSNMSPQKPEFNRGKWSQLEDFVRQYVIESNEPVFVVTGGILTDSLKTIGKEKKISVPKYYYKIIVDLNGNKKKGIAFIMLNGTNTKPIISYAVSIDSVEKVTGIDFFASLPDTLENRIEKMYNIDLWLNKEQAGGVKPLEAEELPKGAINTVDAEKYYAQKATVCGTVVAVKVLKDSKGIVYNLDQKFPYQIFSFTIWKTNIANFSYDPASVLMSKKICITGTIDKYRDKPTMELRNEKAIKFLEDETDD